MTGDDKEAGDLRQLGDQIVGQTLCKVVVLRVSANIDEGQDGDRRLVRQRISEALDLRRWLERAPTVPPERGTRRGEQQERARDEPAPVSYERGGTLLDNGVARASALASS